MQGDCTAAHRQNVDARRLGLFVRENEQEGVAGGQPMEASVNDSPCGDLACAGVLGERDYDERAHEQECHQTLGIARDIPFKHVVPLSTCKTGGGGQKFSEIRRRL